MLKVQRSAQWLADHFEEVPLFLFPFCEHDPSGWSIYPAVWSAMLAARAEGIGQLPHGGARCLPPARDPRDPRRAPRRRGWLLSGCVSFGVPHWPMGRGGPASGGRGHLPQPLGGQRRASGIRPAVATRLTPRLRFPPS